jgi:hypothetical protein
VIIGNKNIPLPSWTQYKKNSRYGPSTEISTTIPFACAEIRANEFHKSWSYELKELAAVAKVQINSIKKDNLQSLRLFVDTSSNPSVLNGECVKTYKIQPNTCTCCPCVVYGQ